MAEVKSITVKDEEKQLRLGLGQVMRYRHLIESRTKREVTAVLVTERAPTDASWLELCRSVGVHLVWPTKFDGLEAHLRPAAAVGHKV